MGTKASIYEESTSVAVSADGQIAGVQMTVIAENLQLNDKLPMTVSSNYINDQYIILVYGLNGETLSGDKIHLITASEDYEITSILVVNTLSHSMNINKISEWFAPEVFELDQNLPNPFNPITQIQFTLGQSELVTMNIFDIQGRLVKSLINNLYYQSGSHKITWDGKNNIGTQVPSGMYIYKLVSNNQMVMRKMILMK